MLAKMQGKLPFGHFENLIRSRFLQAFTQRVQKKLALEEVLAVEHFDQIVGTVKVLSMKKDEDQEEGEARSGLDRPNIALKLGRLLMSTSQIVLSEALKSKDNKSIDDCQKFQELIHMNWGILVGKPAYRGLKRLEVTRKRVIPDPSDILKFEEKSTEILKRAIREFQEKGSQTNFVRLSEITLARIIFFNKRRVGEASKLTLEQFKNRVRSCPCEVENRSKAEHVLLNRLANLII